MSDYTEMYDHYFKSKDQKMRDQAISYRGFEINTTHGAVVEVNDLQLRKDGTVTQQGDGFENVEKAKEAIDWLSDPPSKPKSERVRGQ